MRYLQQDLRVLIDPAAMPTIDTTDLIKIKILNELLNALQYPPCQIKLFSPSDIVSLYEIENCSITSTIHPDVAEAFSKVGSDDSHAMHLISTARDIDADVVVLPKALELEKLHELFSRVNVFTGDWAEVKKYCESFIRGHDYAWSFSSSLVGSPFSTFYVLSEPISELKKLYESACEIEIDPDVYELIRSFALNRHISLVTRETSFCFMSSSGELRCVMTTIFKISLSS